MNNSAFFITVAGLIIKIDTSKISDSQIKDILQQQIITYYDLEIIPKPTKKPHFTIFYIAEEEHRFIRQQQKGDPGIYYYLQAFILHKQEAYIHYHTSIVQFQFFLKMILQTILGDHRGFILHTSAISDGQFVYLFLGPNGIGKSTVVENASTEYSPFSDDMVIVRNIRNKWFAFQLPLEKKHYKKSPNTHVQIKALCYLKQARVTSLKKIMPVTASKRLLEQLIKNGATKKNVKAVLEFLPVVDHYTFETPLKTDLKTIRSLTDSYQE